MKEGTLAMEILKLPTTLLCTTLDLGNKMLD